MTSYDNTPATYGDLKKITKAIKSDREGLSELVKAIADARDKDHGDIQEVLDKIADALKRLDERVTAIEARTNDDALTERLTELKKQKRGWFS